MRLHLSLFIPLIILLLVIFYPVSPPKPKLYELTHKTKLSELAYKKHKVVKVPAKYPGAAIKYKQLNSEYLQTKEKPVQYNPFYYDNGKISIEATPWGEITEKDAALGLQFKIIY